MRGMVSQLIGATRVFDDTSWVETVGWRSAQRVNKQLLHRPFLKHQRVRGVERIVNLLMMNHENNALCAERALTWRGG